MSDQAIRNIEVKLDNLVQRIAKIETQLKIVPAAPPAPAETKAQPTPSSPPPSQPLPAGAPVQDKNRGSWLGWAGILFFILAACYFVKLTIDSGWLTPQRQFVGIVLFGIGLVTAGLKLHSMEKAFSAMIAGAGVVVFYLAAFSGQMVFQLYGANVAIVLTALTTAVSVSLFRIFTHDFFLIAAAVGSYSLPFILRSDPQNIYAITPYFIFWDLAFATFALILQRRLLIALTSYLALSFFPALWTSTPYSLETTHFVCFFQLFQFLLMTAAVLAFSVRNKVALTSAEAWAFSPILVLFYASEYGMIDRLYPGYAPWVALLFAGVICGAYWYATVALKNRSLPSGPVVAAFASMVAFHTIYLELLPREWCSWLAVLILLLPLALPKGDKEDRFWVALLFPKLLVAAEYMRVIVDDDFATMNIVFFGALLLHNLVKSSAFRSSFIVLALAIAQGMRGIYLLVESGVEPPLNQLVTSGCWATLAMLVLLLGYSRRDERTAKAGVMLFAFIAGKVLLNDLDTTDSVIRVISLVGIGALLYAGGIVWKRLGTFESAS